MDNLINCFEFKQTNKQQPKFSQFIIVGVDVKMNNTNFCKDEMVNMIFIFGECHRNINLAIDLYRERYLNLITPHRITIRRVLERFTLTGSVAYPKKRT